MEVRGSKKVCPDARDVPESSEIRAQDAHAEVAEDRVDVTLSLM
jgi:hypothetical protein